jgi:hypothetical protein
MPFDEEKIRTDATLVRDISKDIEEVLNPREFAKAASEVYQESMAAELLRDNFEILPYVYAVTRPSEDECPLEQQYIAEEVIGRPIHTELNAVLAIPKTLMKAESRKAIKVMWRMHGGGGVRVRVTTMLISAKPYSLVEKHFSIHGHTTLTFSMC